MGIKVNIDKVTEEQLPQSAIDARRVVEIDTRLSAIDLDSLRPLRAVANGTAVQADTDKLAALDAEAEELRAERATLVQ